jgi:ABC-type multidrug transport system fused ATPase/permease subunit
MKNNRISLIKTLSWTATLRQGLNLLSASSRKKYVIGAGLHTLTGVLDAVAVALLGVVGYLTVSGFGVGNQSNKINSILNFLGLANYQIKTQTAILALSAAVLFVAKTVLSAVITRKMLYFLAEKSTIASRNLSEQYFNRNSSTILHASKSDSVYSLSEGIDLLTTKSLSIFASIISDAFLLLIMLCGLLIANPLLSICSLIFFGLIARTINSKQTKISKFYGFEMSEVRNRFYDKINEMHDNYREILLRGTKNSYLKDLIKFRSKQANTVAGMAYLQVQSKYIMETSIIIGGLSLSAAAFLTMDAGRAIALLTIFLAAGSRIVPALLRLQNSIIQINNVSGLANSTIKIANENNNLYSESLAEIENTDYFFPKISIKSANFNYPNRTIKVLSEINLELEQYTFSAIVGPTGAGKSTLLDLCLGFIKPDLGSVLINGMQPNEAIRQYPGLISLIPQKINITNSSLRDNIKLGISNENISDLQIINLLEEVQLGDFFRDLPEGLDSTIGEFGSKISGGQRQRLGIARALITNPKLLLLDEATSSLDSETENLISTKLLSLKGTMTIVSVAHRLSTVMNADKVVYMENGKIIKIGKFDELRAAIPNFDSQAKLMGL